MSYIPPGHDSKKYDSGNFDYDKRERDLWDVGDHHPEEIWDYHTEKGVTSYLKERGLDPHKYEKDDEWNPAKDSDDGCYLTTACVGARGLDDNCYELDLLRNFRDTYMKSTPWGRADIIDYYEKAPKIVRAVNSMPDSRSIWYSVYDNLIMPCVELIEQNKPDLAYRKYREYTLDLYNRYIK